MQQICKCVCCHTYIPCYVNHGYVQIAEIEAQFDSFVTLLILLQRDRLKSFAALKREWSLPSSQNGKNYVMAWI